MIMMFMTNMMVTILMVTLMNLSKENNNKNKSSSSFECGFQNMNEKNTFFSSQFFMIAILFLIFDVEISFLIPIPLSENFMKIMNWNLINMMILLLISTKMEWKMGMIEWTK